MNHPLLHPPLQLVRETPLCERCGLPVKWYKTKDIYTHECIDPLCENWHWLFGSEQTAQVEHEAEPALSSDHDR